MDEDDILYGNVSASIWSKLDLMNSHISVIFLAICKSQNNLGIYQVQEM
jgi:hypothetical protein